MITLKRTDPRMIANNLMPYKPTHPGEIIKEEIEYRGMSQRKLAMQMGISHTVINEVLNCKRPVNTEMALLFEATLGIDADLFINMQARYNMHTARRDSTLTKRLDAIRRACASVALA